MPGWSNLQSKKLFNEPRFAGACLRHDRSDPSTSFFYRIGQALKKCNFGSSIEERAYAAVRERANPWRVGYGAQQLTDLNRLRAAPYSHPPEGGGAQHSFRGLESICCHQGGSGLRHLLHTCGEMYAFSHSVILDREVERTCPDDNVA